MAGDVQYIIDVVTTGVGDIANLSNKLQQLNRIASGAAKPFKALDADTKSLNLAIGASGRALNVHAKSLTQLASNQARLSREIGTATKELNGLGKSYAFNATASKSWQKGTTSDLNVYANSLKKIKAQALISDLKSVSLETKRLGKDAQFVGRSLIIGLTTPIAGFARFGLQALVSVDKEFVRLSKIMENIAPNIDAAARKMGINLKNATAAQKATLGGLVNNYNKLDTALTATSNKFGMAKQLTVALAADFAELGLQTTDSIAKITELTAATEKLGDMDIGGAKSLVQSLYFQAQRGMQKTGEAKTLTVADREAKAIGQATAQMNLFNLVENTTALTLKDLGGNFNEVAAIATTFGMSMTEAAALLAPMKAAGLDVGASANSIKIGLQSIVSPTAKTQKMFESLTKQYGDHFSLIKGSGLSSIQALINAYTTLDQSAAGQEGVLQFFTQVFGKRQASRMLIGIGQMADFDKVLKDTGASGQLAEKQLQGFANGSIEAVNKASNANLPLIKSYKDIGVIARIATASIPKGQQSTYVDSFGTVTLNQINAAIKVRDQLSDKILQKSQKEGIDLIGQVATESGRAMFIELAGVKNAQQKADQELANSLSSLETTIQRIKNSFKMFAADLLTVIGPGLDKIAKFATDLYDKWNKLSPATKQLTAALVIGFAAIAAAIGPLIFIFGQFKLAIGSVMGALLSLVPGLSNLSVEAVAAAPKLMNMKKPLDIIGETVVNTNTKFTTLVATIASGEGPMARLAQKFGLMTGQLKKTQTGTNTLKAAVVARETELEGMVQQTFSGSGSILPSGGRKVLSEPKLHIRKIIPEDLKLLDAEKILHEEALADKVAKAGAKKYNQTYYAEIKRLIGSGRIPATGITRFKAGTVDASGKNIGGRLTSFKKVEAMAAAEAQKISNALENTLRSQNIRDIKAFYATKIADLRSSIDLQNKTSLEAFNKQRIIWFNEEAAAKKHAFQMRKADQEAKGITTKLGGQGTGTLIKERFFKGKQIDEPTFDRIMGGGLKGKLTSAKLNLSTAPKRAYESAKKVAEDAYGVSKKVGSKFLGGKTTFKALEGAAEFTKHPIEGIKDMGSALTKVGPKLKTFGSGLIGVFKDPMKFIKDLGPKISGIGAALMELIPEVTGVFEGFLMFTGIGVIIAGVVAVTIIIIKHWKEFRKAIEPGIKAFQDAFKIIKDGIMGAIKPVLDFFGALTNGAGNSSVVVKVVATSFNVLAEVIKFIAKLIKWLLIEVIGRGIKLILGPLLAAIRGVVGVISGIIHFFTKGWKTGLLEILNGVGKFVVGLMGPFSGLFSKILNMIGKVLMAMSHIPFVGGLFKKAANAAFATADFIDKAKDMGNKGGKALGKAITGGVTDAPIQEGISNAVGKGLTDAQKAAQDAAKKILKAVMSEIVSGVLDIVKTNVSNTVSGITDAMKASKDAAMNVFEQQLSTIEKLKKAEDDLTKTKEFELNKRAILDQRAIDHENFTRNKALAIYEGRIDDARAITLDEKKSVKDSNKQMETLQDERNKYLADQNLQSMIDSIQEAKKVAGDFYDEAIKNFETAAKKITEFPPTSAQEYKDQLAKLSAAANTEAGKINTSFSGLMTKLETHMTVDLPNKGVAPFGTGMESLVQIAKDKFGLGTTAGDDKTVIGATISMLSGIQSSITGDTAIGPAVASLTGGITTKFADLTPTLTATGGTIPNLMTAISTAITDNNPMKKGSAWDAAIDLSITTLMEKYKGEFSVLTTTITNKAEGLQKLIDLYTKVQKLNETTSMSGPVDPLGGGDAGDTKIKGLSTGKITNYINTSMKGAFDSTHSNIVGVLSSAVPDIVISGILLGSIGAGIADYKDVYQGSPYWTQIQEQSIKMYHDVLGKDLKPKMQFANGGFVPGFDSSAIPATLHGGEYVVNAKAVKNIGLSTLQNLNNMRLQNPQYKSPRVTQGASGESNQTVHIHVDNFIGEQAWFEKMMKDYNVKVVPQSQRASGMQDRNISTYSGLNRGL